MTEVVKEYRSSLCPMTREELLQRLSDHLSVARFNHVKRVEKVAIELAKKYGVDVQKASLAGLCHDYAKQRPDKDFIKIIHDKHLDPDLLNYGNAIWHGLVGAEMVKDELGIYDEDVLNAIRQHTVGAEYMTSLSQIIYMADYIEPARSFKGVDQARKLVQQSLAAGVAYQTKHTLQYLIDNNQPVYPQTIITYNAWVPKFERN